jgi:hypothetical protein
MCIGEGGVHGEVAAYKKASSRYGELPALVEDVPRVVKAAAVGTCGVIRSSGVVTKGVVSLKGVPHDNLKGGALKAT